MPWDPLGLYERPSFTLVRDKESYLVKISSCPSALPFLRRSETQG